MTVHNLKIHPEPFQALLEGKKTGEVRGFDGRNFKAGDTVNLTEVGDLVPHTPTGRTATREITHVQTGYGLPAYMCVLSYAPESSSDASAVYARLSEQAKTRTSLENVEDVLATGSATAVAALLARNDWLEQVAVEAAETEKRANERADALREELVVRLKQTESRTVTERMVDAAMGARMPGGAAAWVWLFNCEGGQQPEEKHREWFRLVLRAAISIPPPTEQPPVFAFPDMDDSLLEILGTQCFRCSGIAQELRENGADIPRKVEVEQAVVIHWMLTVYLAYGKAWQDFFLEELREVRYRNRPGNERVPYSRRPDLERDETGKVIAQKSIINGVNYRRERTDNGWAAWQDMGPSETDACGSQ